MPAALLNQGRTSVRDSLKTLVSHVGVSTDATAFAATQTTLNPGGGTNLIKAASKADVDTFTFDATMTIDGSTEFTGQSIMTVGALNGPAATNALSRSVRGTGLGIGVQAGDVFTIGVRAQVQDNS